SVLSRAVLVGFATLRIGLPGLARVGARLTGFALLAGLLVPFGLAGLAQGEASHRGPVETRGPGTDASGPSPSGPGATGPRATGPSATGTDASGIDSAGSRAPGTAAPGADTTGT